MNLQQKACEIYQPGKRSFSRMLMGHIVSVEPAYIVIPLLMMGVAIAAATAPIPMYGPRRRPESCHFSYV